ncbi:MAG: SulP family inorganic anion transporter [Cyanobacteria bacterium SZAS LIN-2]|nr:SulP family inorganic anion transporter [Cyanobacteria bacterium SZAS LIN-2]
MTIIAAEKPRSNPRAAALISHKRGTADGLAGLRENWTTDIVSGFVVFLIALPLSLGIAMASGVPPMAGIISAIVGGLVVSMISGSHVTINGPAAGLIVVVLCSVERLGGGVLGYRATLAAIVISGAILVLLGVLRAGQLGKIVPASVVHGMLAAIGIIIMAKQLPFMLGTTALAREPLTLLLSTPAMIGHLNPALAAIGLVSLLILVLHGLNTDARIKRIPAPIIVIVAAVAMSMSFGLDQSHSYFCLGKMHQIDPVKCLVVLPKNVLDGLVLPDFSLTGSYAFWLSVLSITLIQGLESLLSCTAVDRLDPLGRRAHLSRDIAAVGLGSMVAGTLGGLPIIAEIVRSTANVASGARTRWSNFFHGLFALLALIFAAGLINRIPLAALAAILIVTGYKLAAPRIFREVHAVGIEQTIIFVTTIVATLSTDLLIGVMAGISTKIVLHLLRGADLRNLLTARVEAINYADDSIDLVAGGSLLFSNYLSLKAKLDQLPQGKMVWLDLSAVDLIDHSVMEHLHHFAEDYNRRGGEFHLVGLEGHQSASKHPLAARKLVGVFGPGESRYRMEQ